MFVVTDQAPMHYQDSVGLLDPPADRPRDEPLVLRVALDHLDLDPQADAVQDDLVLEAAVDQSLADAAAGVVGSLVQHRDNRGVVVRARGKDADGDHRAEHVHGHAPLAARHPFPASRPVVEAGTPAVTWTLCVSSTNRVGFSNRWAFSRTWQRRSSWMTWSVPSSRHA
ncbi:hypothetical protein OG310_38000 (plasmid) [Streptomyces sp. NBC_01497]